ncbi:MAG TPA: hypothetical protein VD971_08675 [Phycisphaerales bacterium]|nr:hypothetical protein [Phycisphaerales bacterium]
MNIRAVIRPAFALLAASALAPLASCNIVAPAYLLVHGPEKTPALHRLDENRPTVVFIDDRASVLPRRTLRSTIGRAAEQALMSDAGLKQVLDSQAVQAVAARDDSDRPTDIASIGAAVKAEVVVYAAVERFSLTPDGQTYQPFSIARVKVIDVVSGKRRWPEDREGYTLQVILPQRSHDIPSGAAGVAKAQESLAEQLGVALAKLFYKHEARPPAKDRG